MLDLLTVMLLFIYIITSPPKLNFTLFTISSSLAHMNAKCPKKSVAEPLLGFTMERVAFVAVIFEVKGYDTCHEEAP